VIRRAPVPSVRTLAAVFGDNAPAAGSVLLASAPAPNSWLPPGVWDRLGGLAGAYGTECVRFDNWESADYLNAGDPYKPTLIVWRGRWRVQSVGDFIETMERRGLRAV
jgi:hypothetical protein